MNANFFFLLIQKNVIFHDFRFVYAKFIRIGLSRCCRCFHWRYFESLIISVGKAPSLFDEIF